MAYVTVATLSGQTAVVIPRYAGQKVVLNGVVTTGGAAEEPIRVFGSGTLQLGPGYWDVLTIVAGNYQGPPFTGNTYLRPVITEWGNTTTEWNGEPNKSTSTISFGWPGFEPGEWEYVGEFAPGDTFIDYEGVTKGRTIYYVESVSSIPSTNFGIFHIDADSSLIWLGGGPGYTQTLAIPFNFSITESVNLEHSEVFYPDGVSLPTLITGEAVNHGVEVSGKLDPNGVLGSTREEFLKLFSTPGTKMYRDREGRRMYVHVTAGSHEKGARGLYGISFSAQEVTDVE